MKGEVRLMLAPERDAEEAERLLRKVITPHSSEEIVAYAGIDPFCPECGYRESLHRPDADTPNGDSRCPDENTARAAWGDR